MDILKKKTSTFQIKIYYNKKITKENKLSNLHNSKINHIYIMEKTNHDFYIGENKYHITGITFTHRENKYHIYIPGKQISHLHTGKINHNIYIGKTISHLHTGKINRI